MMIRNPKINHSNQNRIIITRIYLLYAKYYYLRVGLLNVSTLNIPYYIYNNHISVHLDTRAHFKETEIAQKQVAVFFL